MKSMIINSGDKIQWCRLCESENLEFIGSLGDLAINDFTDTVTEGESCPLALTYCKDCTLLQLANHVPVRKIYRDNYWYESAINPKIVNNLKEIAEEANEMLEKGDWIVDIGANDGTLLGFIKSGVTRVGVEPAQNLADKLSKHCEYIESDFFEAWTMSIKAKVITAIAMLYDLPYPNLFMGTIKEALAEDGVFIAQLMTLQPMIENNDVGNICHEHLEFYSWKALVELYESNGLEIYDVKQNDINGGSYRIYARHYKKGSIDFQEKEYTIEDYHEFFKRVEDNKSKMLSFLNEARKEGKKVYGYAASTKGNTILQYYGITPDLLPAIGEKNSAKWGKFTIKTGIPIIDEKSIKDADYFWVFPWGFIDVFKEKEKAFVDRGGKFVTSIPEFKII